MLEADRLPTDFTSVHITSANVLQTELHGMEHALFGRVRDEATELHPIVPALPGPLRRFETDHRLGWAHVWSPEMESAAPAGAPR
jgi:hypothetical protein